MVDRFFEGGLEERLEGWIDRGREFVDGVAANAAASNRPRSSFSGSSSNARRPPSMPFPGAANVPQPPAIRCRVGVMPIVSGLMTMSSACPAGSARNPRVSQRLIL